MHESELNLPLSCSVLRKPADYSGLVQRKVLVLYRELGFPDYRMREIHFQMGILGGDTDRTLVEQNMQWTTHVLRSDKSMGCQERGSRENNLHTHFTAYAHIPPGVLGLQMLRNSINTHTTAVPACHAGLARRSTTSW
jgi:hypothetical protein